MFGSREDAGRQLARLLQNEGVKADLVLGLPRGGVVVAAEVAHTLELPLDVIVVRKIGHPLQREFAVGAMAEPDIVLLDERILAKHRQNIRTSGPIWSISSAKKRSAWQLIANDSITVLFPIS
jgi:predicted phosphoribosyltransferase